MDNRHTYPFTLWMVRNEFSVKEKEISKQEVLEDLYCGLRNPYARWQRKVVA